MKFYLTMYATQVLPEDLSEKTAKEDDGVEVVGFIVIDAKRFEIKKGDTKIGRDPTMCSVVVENFTVSKVHAVIESEGVDDTFIYDVGSTNQTKLGKKTLKPHCRYKLEHYSNITFGNITAKFMLPHEIRKNSESNFNLGEPDGVEDIFDVATQVGVSHPHISGKVLHIEEVPDNVKVFKIPDLVVSGKKVKESPRSSNSSTEVIKCQLDTQDLVSRAEFYNGSFDASGIFSLSTQCQIIQSSSKKNKSEDTACTNSQRNGELDTVKSLLNDGHDSILCTFMSLHSPGGQAPCKLVEVKTEITEDNLNQIFDKQTQAYAMLPQASAEKHVQQDLCCQDTPKPSIKGTPLNNRFKLIHRNEKKNITEPVEDFIKTQEFPQASEVELMLNSLPSEKDADKTSVQTAHQDSGSECHLRKSVGSSIAEEPTENEDLISTQKYEVLVGGIQGATNNAPENEELSEAKGDFMETQLYDVEEEKSKNLLEQGIAGKPAVVSESPERGSELYVEGNTDLTQRNIEEDFISTQVFGEMTSNKDADISNSGSQGRTDDVYNDEDFIMTQPVDLPASSCVKYKCVQGPSSRIEIASRESSPDLLDSGFSAKASTDFINRSPKAAFSEFSEQIDSVFSTNIKKELGALPATGVERVESSGDETESDLEIIFDKSDTAKKTTKAGEFGNNAQSPKLLALPPHSDCWEDANEGSNSSYIFELEPEVQVEVVTKENIVNNQGGADNSDSDATVCEDITGFGHEMPTKHELLEKATFEETQVLTLTAPENFPHVPCPNDGCVTDKESPRFDIGNDNECWSQLSLEMPNTQDMEATINKIIHNNYVPAQKRDQKHEDHQAPSKILKTEVGTENIGSNSTHRKSEGQVDSPLKRPGSSSIVVEAVPTKKSKMEPSERKLRSSEKQFLRLWQAHDIEQIQPSRTRNSLKNPAPENTLNETNISLGKNISNKLATSRRETRTKRKNSRKLSFDITSYLCNKMENNKSPRGRKKETPPKENTRAFLVGKKETPTEHRVEPKSVECCHRVLRSSKRKSGNISPTGSVDSPARIVAGSRSRRNSRFKSEEYFSNSCVHIVFTGFYNESLEQIITNLGGKKTDDLSLGDVVVADKVRRTVKFLSAVSLSLPIASPQWLLASRAEKRFQNPWNFILKDDESERKWNFELRASLERSKKAKLMQGLSIFATANTKPPVKDLLAIVECCGGTPLFDPPDTWPKKTVIVSCPEDKKYWPLAKCRNIKIVHYEFILSGVLSQKLDFKTYKLR